MANPDRFSEYSYSPISKSPFTEINANIIMREINKAYQRNLRISKALSEPIEYVESTVEVMYDILDHINSHLADRDYDGARRQFRYLRRINLDRFLDGDDDAKEIAQRTILRLQKSLN